jgi:hypothetical protein
MDSEQQYLQENGGGEGYALAAGPGMATRRGSGMRRRLSRRNLGSRRNLLRGSEEGSDGGANLTNDAAAVAAAFVDEDEGIGGVARSNPSSDASGQLDRQNSWYADVLMQGGADGLGDILGEAIPPPSAAAPGPPVADDDEVLEQYRIMAHVEANIRVKENTGFDLGEYEKRRKLEVPANSGNHGCEKKVKPRLPEAKKVLIRRSNLNPEEPKLPPAQINRKYIDQRGLKVPEICIGEKVASNNTTHPRGEHVIRCLGCRAHLRVKILAILARCPDCNTLSPCSSTRR